jgi:hypothetical protein
MYWAFATAALGLLNGQIVLAVPILQAHHLELDLGYGIYQGAYNSTTQLNVWKGYVRLNRTGQNSPKREPSL